MLNIHRPLRIAVLCSHRAPGLMYLLNRSPDRGVSFEIVCVVTSEHTFDEEVRVERRGIPTLVHPIHDFYKARGAAAFNDVKTRRAYDAETAKRIEPYFADLILLDGYLNLVTEPLLEAFPNRIINLHFSDLTLRHRNGSPRFPGIRAVRDAILAGCTSTRATVHLVNERADEGAPIVLSWPFAVSSLVDELRMMAASHIFGAYVFAHQQWMMQAAAGPLLAVAFRLVSIGAVDLDGLARAAPGTVRPWRLEPDGGVLTPEVEAAGVPALAHA